jgi:hypothetical protein
VRISKLVTLGLVFFAVLWSCVPVKEVEEPRYTVQYVANGADSGEVPIDSGRYKVGDQVIIAGQGTLGLTGYNFTNWNTAPDGSGVSYAVGQEISMGQSSITLYAQWTDIPTYSLTYDGNGYTAGNPPIDGNGYTEGAPVTIASQGSLVREGVQL